MTDVEVTGPPTEGQVVADSAEQPTAEQDSAEQPAQQDQVEERTGSVIPVSIITNAALPGSPVTQVPTNAAKTVWTSKGWATGTKPLTPVGHGSAVDTVKMTNSALSGTPQAVVVDYSGTVGAWTNLGWSETVVAATGVKAGSPGSFTPASAQPANLAAIGSDPVIGNAGTSKPTTAWTTGQYVVLDNHTWAYWNGTAWTAGQAP